MKFLPEGPSIPDELLEDRDRGNVVFFCGAGVSLSAGMPTFDGLCEHVVQTLGVPDGAHSRHMLNAYDDTIEDFAHLPPLDQIFNVLQQEYNAGEIDYVISRRLMPRRNASLTAHETILRLSRSTDGTTQVVTTNFDYLFEKASNKRLKTFVPPALPDLPNGQSLDGLVYLHGRVNGRMRRGDGRQGFVLSSSDFGRAYLAEGWATRFVRDLLERYTVILLGYSASDPPVRYLLQGLHTRGHGQKPSIYAFDEGTPEDVSQKWRDSGVSPLAYAKTDQEHSALWRTLDAWADRADDPIAWHQGIVELSQNGPRSLTPEQRGQVVSIVRTDVGAKLFADSDPPPPAEWICVLDSSIRYAKPSPECDPLTEYGLDDDPPRPSDTRSWNVSPSIDPGDDLFRLQPGETQHDSLVRLAGVPRRWADPLSTRLAHLASWIGKVLHEPVVAWWASRYETLHPATLADIERRVERNPCDLPAPARDVWLRLIEIFRAVPEEKSDDSWHDTTTRIGLEGWTPSVLRSFARATQPYLTAKLPFLSAAGNPPENKWPKDASKNIIEFEVKFPPHDPIDQESIPENVVHRIYKILRWHLEWAADLLTDIDPQQWWPTSSFYPEDRSGTDRQPGEASTYLHWFRSILDRLIDQDPSYVNHDVALWPKEERFFFDKLRLYVWSFPNIVDADIVARSLITMSDEAFWEVYNRRELLMFVRARWADFSHAQRMAIETRITDGHPLPEGEDCEEYLKRRSIESATMLGWLLLQGLSLSAAARRRLALLRIADPNWTPEWDERAASSNDSVGGIVREETDPSCLLGLPLAQILRVASENTRSPLFELVKYCPFDGFVAASPARAVSALTHAGRQGDYPVEFWRSVLTKWPDDVRERLRWLLAERLARLPQQLVLELRFELFGWVEKNLRIIARSDLEWSLQLLDDLLDKLVANSSEATQSSLGTRSIGGEPIKTSRRTYGHAINSPIGKCTQLLLCILNDLKPDAGEGIPELIRTRLIRLTRLPGEGRDHAVCIITHATGYLDHVDPDWISHTIAPWFNLDHERAEPAWNGFLHRGRLPRPELFSVIKPYFLAAVAHISGWYWDDHAKQVLHRLLIQGCLVHRKNQNYVSFAEARLALQATDDFGRGHCLGFVAQVLREDHEWWPKFGRPFWMKRGLENSSTRPCSPRGNFRA